jgi:AraC-like DNA-binding protein
MSHPTVSAGYARALLDFAVAQGASAEVLQRRSGLDNDALADPDNRVPLQVYKDLMSAAKVMCDDPALPLHLGAARNFTEISVVGLICYSAATMGEALMELNRFGRLVAELDLPEQDERFQVQQIDGASWLVDTRTDPNGFPEMTEETWARFICETARNFPGKPFALSVHVTHARPEHGDVYEQVMQVPVVFESVRNAIRFDPAWLTMPTHRGNTYAFGVLSERAEKLRRALESSRTTRGQVERFLIPVLHKGDANMAQVAAALGMSRQSLYRRLKAEGISFEDLHDVLRHRMALHYLDARKVSVNETAYLVGFSDPSSFSRAFKRWTGDSPGSWKRA